VVSAFSFPTLIRFGAGASAELPDHLRRLGVKRPLLVTDEGLAKTPIFERLKDALARADIPFSLFDRVRPNPEPAQIEAAAAVYRGEACDGIVGFGGGSGLDAAKAVRIAATHDGSILEYGAGGSRELERPLPPLVAIPTTAGTGSEVGRSTVVTDPARRAKRVIFHPRLLADVALCDPDLTQSLPPPIAAATGMDALSHAIESYCSTEFHPLCDAVALGGVRLIARALKRAVHQGREDAEARADMMMAALMGGIAFQKDLGATHSLAHPLSTLADVPHGTANGLLLWRVMRFNAAAATTRLADIAHALGVPPAREPRDQADAAWREVEHLAGAIGIPRRLRDVGVTPDLLEPLARAALEDSCHRTNPRPCTYEDLLALYREAF